MNVDELRQHLRNPEEIRRDPFSILKALSLLFNEGSEDACRDMSLRALENRGAFGNYESILSGLIRELGLFPYLQESELSLADTIAFEYHRPEDFDDPLVFHREQAEIYRRLLNGENIILSAPTSFGKSRVIDAVIAARRFKNVVVIVPTIALIDETRRRLSSFSPEFKVVTQLSQRPGERNVSRFHGRTRDRVRGSAADRVFRHRRIL